MSETRKLVKQQIKDLMIEFRKNNINFLRIESKLDEILEDHINLTEREKDEYCMKDISCDKCPEIILCLKEKHRETPVKIKDVNDGKKD